LRRSAPRIVTGMSAAQAVALNPLPASPSSDDVEFRRERWIPEWVRRVGAASWVTGPSGRIVYMNERAAELLGADVGNATGRPCHEVVASRTATGAPFCASRCRVVAECDGGGEVAPHEVQVGGRGGGGRHWLQMTSIPIESPDRARRWIVHIAHVLDRSRRIELHMARVAARSEEIREVDEARARRPLSPREREVLELLAHDVELRQVAARLGITYVTVRNHVQHVLAKLGAHSVEEAVAMHVLATA
jgi:DNA-binding CsgD family transcriptional regulator/PAS domain-containing protein